MAYRDLLLSARTRLFWQELLTNGRLDSKWFGTIIAKLSDHHRYEKDQEWLGNRDSLMEESLSSHVHKEALQFVFGPYSKHLVDLVTWMRITRSAEGIPFSPLVSPKRTGARTPNLPPPARSFVYPFNVTPEWIRQGLNAWHNEAIHKKRTNQKYFPFKYRDHLIHPITVWLVGHLLLQNYRMPPWALRHIREAVAGNSKLLKIEKYLEEDLDLCDIIAMIWQQKVLSDGGVSGGEVSNITSRDVLLAWQDVALWHDAGYDSLFWCLTNAVEFSHCRIYEPCEVTARIVKCCNVLLTQLPLNDIPQKLKEKLEQVTGPLKAIDPYHLVWEIDESQTDDPSSRVWGRSHATLSAYEFIKQHRKAKPACYPMTLPSLAIAEHHEVFYRGDDQSKLATEFVRSPFGCVLRWADQLAMIPRLKLEWISAGNDEEKNYPHAKPVFNDKDYVLLYWQNGQLTCTIKEGRKKKKNGTIASFLWGTVIK